jgi:hypothetical protein
VEQARTSDPFGIKKILQDDPAIQTIIFDSVTKFAERATIHAIGKAPGSTFENPGPSQLTDTEIASLSNWLAISLSQLAQQLNTLSSFVTKTYQTLNKDGQVESIPILLGGSLKQEVPLQISEVWHMRDTGSDRRITIRSAGLRKPMKSRMFDTATGIEFTSSTKAAPLRIRLDSLIEQWHANKLQQLKVPT